MSCRSVAGSVRENCAGGHDRRPLAPQSPVVQVGLIRTPVIGVVEDVKPGETSFRVSEPGPRPSSPSFETSPDAVSEPSGRCATRLMSWADAKNVTIFAPIFSSPSLPEFEQSAASNAHNPWIDFGSTSASAVPESRTSSPEIRMAFLAPVKYQSNGCLSSFTVFLHSAYRKKSHRPAYGTNEGDIEGRGRKRSEPRQHSRTPQQRRGQWQTCWTCSSTSSQIAWSLLPMSSFNRLNLPPSGLFVIRVRLRHRLWRRHRVKTRES